MTDTNDSGQLTNGAKMPEDEEIIELTDVVEKSPSEDEEIIDLTDIVEEPSAAVEEVTATTEVSEDEETVSISDDWMKTHVEAEVDEPSDMALEIPDDMDAFDDPEVTDDSFDEAEIGIEVDEAPAEDSVVIDEDEAFDEHLDMVDEEDDDFIESMGMDLEVEDNEPEAKIEEEALSTGVSLTQEQVEKSLERVIEKMFSEKIENVLVAVIEKLVSKEIEKLKGILLEESTGDE
jgi:hypothetical protein